MKQRILPPIKESPQLYEALEALILKLLREALYKPLLSSLSAQTSTETFHNSKSNPQSIIEAVMFHKITYDRGLFKGQFSAKVSKELKALGATWDSEAKGWRIPKSELPMGVRTQISSSESEFEKRLKSMDKKLAQILPEEIAGGVKMTELLDRTLWKVDKEFKKNVKGIVVSPDLTPEQRKRIAEEYTHNLNRYIKDFAEKEIVDLRKTVQTSVFKGSRQEVLAKKIRHQYGVTERKAKFLARQETSLMVTQFKEERYKDAGINEYIWGCVAGSGAHPVRPMHKALEGKKFSFDNPPITSPEGDRNNPGQDYNCRCFARPVVKFKGK